MLPVDVVNRVAMIVAQRPKRLLFQLDELASELHIFRRSLERYVGAACESVAAAQTELLTTVLAYLSAMAASGRCSTVSALHHVLYDETPMMIVPIPSVPSSEQ